MRTGGHFRRQFQQQDSIEIRAGVQINTHRIQDLSLGLCSLCHSIDQARKSREDAEALVAEQRELLAEAHRQRADATEQGRKEAERLKGEILDQANQQREQLLKQTEEQVRSELRQARSELRGFAADLAIGAAERLLARNLDGDTQRKLVDEYLADLERG